MGSEEGGDRVVGSVDEKGQLVTQGPKKRSAMRILQGLFALGSGASAIYGATVCQLLRVWCTALTILFRSLNPSPSPHLQANSLHTSFTYSQSSHFSLCYISLSFDRVALVAIHLSIQASREVYQACLV